MGAAIGSSHVVGIAVDVFVVVAIAPGHGDFDLDRVKLVAEIDDLADRSLVLNHAGHVFAKAMLSVELMRVSGVFVFQDEMDAGEKIALLFQAVINGVPGEFDVGENLRIGFETNSGSVLFGVSQNGKRSFKRPTVMELYFIGLAFTVNSDGKALRQSIGYRGADAMKTS